MKYTLRYQNYSHFCVIYAPPQPLLVVPRIAHGLILLHYTQPERPLCTNQPSLCYSLQPNLSHHTKVTYLSLCIVLTFWYKPVVLRLLLASPHSEASLQVYTPILSSPDRVQTHSEKTNPKIVDVCKTNSTYSI